MSTKIETSEHPESIAALKANLFYAEALKQTAHNKYCEALIKYHQAVSALNEAIVKRNE